MTSPFSAGSDQDLVSSTTYCIFCRREAARMTVRITGTSVNWGCLIRPIIPCRTRRASQRTAARCGDQRRLGRAARPAGHCYPPPPRPGLAADERDRRASRTAREAATEGVAPGPTPRLTTAIGEGRPPAPPARAPGVPNRIRTGPTLNWNRPRSSRAPVSCGVSKLCSKATQRPHRPKPQRPPVLRTAASGYIYEA